MADGPASMIEKYQLLRQRAYEMGKAFVPRVVKAALESEYMERRGTDQRPTDLDIFPDDDVLAESEARARAIRFDDKSVAKSELEEMKREADARLAKMAAEGAVQQFQEARLRELEEANARLAAQVAQLLANGTAPVPAAAGEGGVAVADDGPAPVLPSEMWKRDEIVAWIDQKGYDLPARTRAAGTKAELLEFALGMAEQEA